MNYSYYSEKLVIKKKEGEGLFESFETLTQVIHTICNTQCKTAESLYIYILGVSMDSNI